MNIERYKDLIGTAHYFDTDDVLEYYSKDYSFTAPCKPLSVIKPQNTEQIKNIIDLSNETRIPIIPISSGFPKFHGDTVPSCPGISMDLSGLDKVLRVDRRNRVAAVEPGVTFNKLRQALASSKMIPYSPLLPRSTKSVMASALERESITVPREHWNFNDPIVAGEVVTGDGHIQGFGESAGRTKEEVASGLVSPIVPLGPSNVGWLDMVQGAMGTLGVVRWVSVSCRLKPVVQKPFFVTAQDLKDLLPFMQTMLRLRFADELFIVNSLCLATIDSDKTSVISKTRRSLPPWLLFLNICGYERYPEKEVEWKEEQLTEAASGAKIELKSEAGLVSAADILKILDEASTSKDRRLRLKNTCQVLVFNTTLDKTPGLLNCLIKMAKDYKYPSKDLSVYIQPVLQGCQCECEVVFPYGSKSEKETVKRFYEGAVWELHRMGAYYSRPYGILAQITFKDAGLVSLLRRVKSVLDPNDIMNSGKLPY